jgi:anti-sigma-K factor RskA
MTQDHISDLLPGYALGTLDEIELVQVSRHLPDCAQCRQELVLFWQTADQLALAMPLRTPPPDLRAKILKRVENLPASRPQPAPAVAPAARPRATLLSRLGLKALFDSLFASRVGMALGGLALVLVALLINSNVLLSKRVNDLQALVPAGDIRLVDLVGTSHAPAAHGYLMVFKDETYGTLVVEDVPALEADHQYQLWLIKDGKRTSGGVFSIDGQGYGTLQVSADYPLDTYPSFGITIEPSGGSPGPTGAKVLGGDL